MHTHEAFLIDKATVDLAEQVLDTQGQLQVLPASFYAGTTPAERMRLCVSQGLYCLPTTELVEHLRILIGDRSALEIGAGNGVIGQALGIQATDNRVQELPEFQAYYARLGQATVRYGAHVERLDACEAVEKYRPQVVLGAWVTHRYDPGRPEAGGNERGIDEDFILDHCDAYVLIGNEHVHRGKSIWTRPHEIIFPSWLYSRAINGSRDFIAVWQRSST